MNKAAVVLIAFNRPEALVDLINQIGNNVNKNTFDLIISIDKGRLQEVIYDAAHQIQWPFGEKKILLRDAPLGLKGHVLQCGDLSQSYDYIVVLEEDLTASRFALSYAHEAASYYADDPMIAGVSLYSYSRRESDKMQFRPINDGHDVYFMQFCSSWGQIWTRRQWESFRDWLQRNDDDNFYDERVPQYVQQWPKSSWKKHFIRYMIDTNKFFVFPHTGLSTNLGIDGTHHNRIFKLYSSSILFGPKEWSFQKLSNAEFLYDANFLLSRGEAPAGLGECQEFKEGRKLGGAGMFFEANPLRATLLFKVFLKAALNDFKKAIRKFLR